MIDIESIPTPNCNLASAYRHRTQPVGEFLNWLREQNIILVHDHDQTGGYVPVYETIESLLARWVGIDPIAWENEKRALLDALREMNGAKS